jgi:hypothetical protein
MESGKRVVVDWIPTLGDVNFDLIVYAYSTIEFNLKLNVDLDY